MTEHPTFDESALSAYLDNELAADERAEVERRLDEPEVRAVLDEVRATRDAVRALPAVDAPAGFWDQILEGPVRPKVAHLDVRRVRRALPSRKRWIALPSAAAAAVLVAVMLVPRPTQVEPRLSTLTESHAARSSLGNDPVSTFAPVSAELKP